MLRGGSWALHARRDADQQRARTARFEERAATVYELWYRPAGTMVPAGLLEAGHPTGTTVLGGHLDGADGVGVTAEPRGGSDTPTSAPLALFRI